MTQPLAHLQEAVTTNRQAQQRLYEGHGLAAIGDVYRDLGNYEQAQTYYQASLQLRQEIGDRLGEGWMLSAIAQAYIAQGLPAEAQGYLEPSCKLSQHSVRTKIFNLPVSAYRMNSAVNRKHKRRKQGTEYKKRFPLHEASITLAKSVKF